MSNDQLFHVDQTVTIKSLTQTERMIGSSPRLRIGATMVILGRVPDDIALFEEEAYIVCPTNTESTEEFWVLASDLQRS